MAEEIEGLEMRAEDFFPLGWLDRAFRRQPYPDMTYGEAISAAHSIIWNIPGDDALALGNALEDAYEQMAIEHDQFEGRSTLKVVDLNELWRGKVTTLLTWFQKEGAK